MASRTRTFTRMYAEGIRGLAARERSRAPDSPERILLPHASLLGDTLLLTATLAKLRERHPRSEIVHVMPEAFVPLYEGRPYGAIPVGWNASDLDSLERLFERGPFDVAYINGDNRFSWLAAGMGARRIVAFEGDRPAYKSWPVDDARPMPSAPMSWSDMVTTLVPGPDPAPYARGAWPPPHCEPFELPRGPYAVLHMGSSHVHKTWMPERWAAVAKALEARGLEVVWSAGPGEEHFVQAVPGADRQRSYAGRLALAQLWHLLASSRLLVSPDTSVAHLGRVVFTPTVILFGPSSPTLGAPGSFWRNCPTEAVAVEPFECRDQTHFFKREVAWIRRCTRGPAECARALCMEAIEPQAVLAAADRLLSAAPTRPAGGVDAANGPIGARAVTHIARRQ